ncbi:hypothetical protein QO016_004510 [Methylobacterium persicinum]|jgi:hypothetical protein|uniref:Uncharacterized protein n=1 Tax=Methylobacterium persicinum TaxID=374426 RepID=A0ABU0HRL6_9HYPH|nr:hypothetical protein [Methylobacterium persicinum]GJE37390.1 hypothetical protein KHHGKMAE_1446 [Methylobacterium persicinum]
MHCRTDDPERRREAAPSGMPVRRAPGTEPVPGRASGATQGESGTMTVIGTTVGTRVTR